VNNRQRLELTSQAGPSTTLKKARKNIETELVEHPLKKNLGRIASRSPTSALACAALYELVESQASRAIN